MYGTTKVLESEGEIMDAEEGGFQPPAMAQTVSSLDVLVRVAQSIPARNLDRIGREAVITGRRMGRDGFYSFPAGGGQIEGATIGMAYALAALWGRCQTIGQVIHESGNTVTIRGIAIDVLHLTTVERDYVFNLTPPPGKFASKPDQAERWRTMQMQSAMSKAIRGAILGLVPQWVAVAAVDAAMEAASSSILSELKAKDVSEGARLTVDHWVAQGLTVDQIEALAGSHPSTWTIDELDVMHRYWIEVRGGRTTIGALRAKATKAPVSEPTAPAAAVFAKKPGGDAEALAARLAARGWLEAVERTIGRPVAEWTADDLATARAEGVRLAASDKPEATKPTPAAKPEPPTTDDEDIGL